MSSKHDSPEDRGAFIVAEVLQQLHIYLETGDLGALERAKSVLEAQDIEAKGPVESDREMALRELDSLLMGRDTYDSDEAAMAAEACKVCRHSSGSDH